MAASGIDALERRPSRQHLVQPVAVERDPVADRGGGNGERALAGGRGEPAPPAFDTDDTRGNQAGCRIGIGEGGKPRLHTVGPADGCEWME